MNIKRYCTILAAGFLNLLLFQTVYANDLQPVCSTCHENTASVIKAPHEKVASFSKCTDCHTQGSKAGSLGDRIHIKHTEALGSSEDTCLTCHKENSSGKIVISGSRDVIFDKDAMKDLNEKYATWNSSSELADSHRKAGVGCSACHSNYDYDDGDKVSEKCIACHGGYPQLAPKTADKHRNPHKSHYGNLSCARCHQVHEPFVDYCDKCHHTNMKWTKKK